MVVLASQLGLPRPPHVAASCPIRGNAASQKLTLTTAATHAATIGKIWPPIPTRGCGGGVGDGADVKAASEWLLFDGRRGFYDTERYFDILPN